MSLVIGTGTHPLGHVADVQHGTAGEIAVEQ
jgi:hypothetical protein